MKIIDIIRAVLWYGVPIAFLGIGLHYLFKLLRCSYEIEAWVEEIKRSVHHDEDGTSVSYEGYCKYTYKGESYVSESITFAKGYFVGDTIKIHINPRKPEEAIERNFNYYFFLVLFLVLPSFFIYSWIK